MTAIPSRRRSGVAPQAQPHHSGFPPNSTAFWIPAPRLRGDKLRENDRRECRDVSLPGVWGWSRAPGVIARSEATKQSQGGRVAQDKDVDCRAFSSLGSENGSQ
jgi:hypothetical protein